MGNVPPQRFNYQQRVGRAGRRGEPLAYALTLCRLRTHDDHYFTHTERDRKCRGRLHHILICEVRTFLYGFWLKRSYTTCFLAVIKRSNDRLTRQNVHGEFGKVSDWKANRERVVEWMQNNEQKIKRIVQLLVTETELKDSNRETHKLGE